jgi:glycosyltransferase involved in cell wall biosynthesis
VQGVCSARNRGILEARGDLIALLDDDDIMYADRLERQIRLYDEHPEASVISCWDDQISADGSILSRNNIPGEIFWAKALLGKSKKYRQFPFIFCLPSTMLFPKSLAIKVGLYDIRFNPWGVEDMEFGFRMYNEGPVLVVPRSGIMYRRTEGESFEVEKWNEAGYRSLSLWKNTNLLFHVLYEFVEKNHELGGKGKLKPIQSQWLREFGCFLMRYPEKRPAAKILLKRAVFSMPLDLKAWKSYFRSYYPEPSLPRVFHFAQEEDFPEQFLFPESFEEKFFSIPSIV